MRQPIKILFIAFHHRVNDPRLCYREIGVINGKFPDSTVFTLTLSGDKRYNHIVCTKNLIVSQKYTLTHMDMQYPLKNTGAIHRYYNKFCLKLGLTYHLIATCRKLKPDIIQASDARELFFTVILSKFCKCKIIYDSHEDYYRQILDYRSGILKYLSALVIMFSEIIWIRFFSAVFCTDEFLLAKYKKRIYNTKKINLLRNYPYQLMGDAQKTYVYKKTLRLVYIGGVNKHRGVIECAKYVQVFNAEFCDKQLIFDVYSPNTPITDKLEEEGLINHTAWIDYLELMNKLSKYDIGICLWLPIKKFYRNLPLKNFDYMACGLPIITSNFGNLKKYIIEPNSGICIDPTSYNEFKDAILKMFKPDTRKEYSLNGLRWIREHGLFENEAKEYIKILRELSK